MESYQQNRLLEPSPPIHPGKTIRPATVNRELACMKTMLNRAVRHGNLNINPISNVKQLPENNIRMRVLTLEEFERLLDGSVKNLARRLFTRMRIKADICQAKI